MGRITIGTDTTITFKPDTHQYFDNEQNEYKSVTRVLKKLQVPFDKAKISGIMASNIAREQGISQQEAQTNLLAEWDQKRDSSIDRGESIHKGIELFLRTGNKVMDLISITDFMRDLVQPYYRYYPETILYDKETKIAGQTDLIIQRQKSADSIYDFYDYKTNESKGIQFDSIGRKSVELRHYNRMFLSPLDYLEDCNYNLYSLQLSMYAYLAQVTYGIRIGRLGIIFIDNDMKINLFPVNYLKMEAQLLAEYSASVNPLPKSKGMISRKVESEVSYNDEDWTV